MMSIVASINFYLILSYSISDAHGGKSLVGQACSMDYIEVCPAILYINLIIIHKVGNISNFTEVEFILYAKLW